MQCQRKERLRIVASKVLMGLSNVYLVLMILMSLSAEGTGWFRPRESVCCKSDQCGPYGFVQYGSGRHRLCWHRNGHPGHCESVKNRVTLDLSAMGLVSLCFVD